MLFFIPFFFTQATIAKYKNFNKGDLRKHFSMIRIVRGDPNDVIDRHVFKILFAFRNH